MLYERYRPNYMRFLYWKRKFNSTNEPVVTNKTKELEEENLRLRQLVANLSLKKLDLLNLLQKKSKI